MTASIRGYKPSDLPELYRICLRTGDSGDDATGRYADPDLLGHVYVGPYVELEPELVFVVEDDIGVAGYVLGALDTTDFEERAERRWWPPLRDRYPAPDPDRRDSWTPDERIAHLIHHPVRTPEERVAAYPSHLHIDLLPRCQGRGYGRQLIETLCDALRERGSHGVHLGVGVRNQRAIGFYRHVGFHEIDAHPGGLVMAKPLGRRGHARRGAD